MFDEQRRREMLSASSPPHGRDVRPLIETTFSELLNHHPGVRSVRWVQSLNHPSGEVFIVHDVEVEFTSGARLAADTGETHGDIEPEGLRAYAVLADLLLTQTDLLVAAFGLGVRVTATASEITTASCRA